MAINTKLDPFLNKAAGRGFEMVALTTTGGSTTAAAATSGNFTIRLNVNAIGSTTPSTLQSIPMPPSLGTNLFHKMTNLVSTSARSGYLANLYKIGTLNLAATGDQFTHDSATFPLLRTVYGQSSQPISLIPIIYVTTATATTAPVIRMRTAAGAAGYVDQDGNSIVGTRTITFPAAATAVESGFIFRLESGDSGVRDISNIEVTTAGTAGAATIYGMEIIAPTWTPISGTGSTMDSMFGGLSVGDMYPAVATSGTATSLLCSVTIGVTTTATTYLTLKGFMS